MKNSLVFRFATEKVLRLSTVITLVLIIWHFTLLKSGIPFIDHPISWLTTLLSPLFAFCGINVIIYLYKRKYKPDGELFGNITPAGYDGHDFFVIIGLILFFLLLPIIGFYLPTEVLLGILYYKQSIYQELLYSWKNLTPKEGMFVICKSIFLLMGLSFIIWEILIHIFLVLRYIWIWTFSGKNEI